MKHLRLAIGLLLTTTLLSSCFKQSFDTPPDVSEYDPNIPVNLTIAQLSTMALSLGTGAYAPLGDSTIQGVVTADDRSGNFYKQIVIQDSTGGIAIVIAQTNLYNDYPIGRKVYVKLKGLTIIDYKGLPEVVFSVNNTSGSLTTNGIPPAFLATNIIKASYPHTVVPTKVRLTDLASGGAAYLNLLVELENMEFQAGSNNMSYAAPSTISVSTGRYIQDCPYTSNLEMYNSGYADFQPYLTPNGKGTITGIYSYYGAAPQLLIRDTTDIKLTEPRDCQ